MPSQNKPKVTPASQWKKSAGAGTVDVELPSGNIAKIRQIPMPTLLGEGIFPDSLQGYIKKAIGEESKAAAADKPGQPSDRKPKKSSKKKDDIIGEKEIAEMMEDPRKLEDMFSVFDKVTVMAVVEPKVLPAPAEEGERDSEKLYVDEVDLQDKTFIFQFCVGGSKDLERFRTESTSVVGSLADIQELQITSQ
ncbi:tail assembly chaperone [Arthrobacter phage Wollypog]|uniref:Tail assembly chaperone n=1 Tax=Arthrobacter phage Wollypog TaxID=2790985 RepID=A0A7T3N1G6_9CAUD|nr:tail assembly chaperone [Arthrobacter phage Wollypog]QPX62568.1 tail assembly chaperone [Arthrobacter phage Wollypog]